ncbi:MAG: hypothetical protein HRU19_29945 [Pseudobacteriovorax sp.]|nr:hypothetical protein [Pseudobacteriovorax sp.]
MGWRKKNKRINTIDPRRIIEIDKKIREGALERKVPDEAVTTSKNR